MQLVELSLLDKNTGLSLVKSNFTYLTLLIGKIGAGKSTIINSILKLKKIVTKGLFSNLKWSVKFKDNNEQYFTWNGDTGDLAFCTDSNENQFDTISYAQQLTDDSYIHESIYRNDQEIFVRFDGNLYYHGQKYCELNDLKQTILAINNDLIQELTKSIKNIFYIDCNVNDFLIPENIYIQHKFVTDEDIASIDNICHRLLFCYLNAQDKFEDIKEKFIEIFAFVEDFKFVKVSDQNYKNNQNNNTNNSDNSNSNNNDNSNDNDNIYILKFKENGVDNWIDVTDISSGQLKILTLLTAFYTSKPDTIYLFEEFGDSLGCNCIDLICYELQHYNDRQIIFSTRNQFIIDFIPRENWRSVTRHGSRIYSSPLPEELYTTYTDMSYFELLDSGKLKSGIF